MKSMKKLAGLLIAAVMAVVVLPGLAWVGISAANAEPVSNATTTTVVPGSPYQVWDVLLDENVVCAVVPHCTSVTTVVPNSKFQVAVSLKFGNVTSSLPVDVTVVSQNPGESLGLALSGGQGVFGAVSGDISIALAGQPGGQTQITYTLTNFVASGVLSGFLNNLIQNQASDHFRSLLKKSNQGFTTALGANVNYGISGVPAQWAYGRDLKVKPKFYDNAVYEGVASLTKNGAAVCSKTISAGAGKACVTKFGSKEHSALISGGFVGTESSNGGLIKVYGVAPSAKVTLARAAITSTTQIKKQCSVRLDGVATKSKAKVKILVRNASGKYKTVEIIKPKNKKAQWSANVKFGKKKSLVVRAEQGKSRNKPITIKKVKGAHC